MRRGSPNNYMKALGNQGFSLIELIISIAILVIIMLPLMNNFYHSALLNKKAEDIQIQSNLASNIMESLKNLNLENITDQGDIAILTDALGNPDAQEILLLNHDTASDTYQFAVNGINESGKLYDITINMQSGTYRQPNPTLNPILNSYPMPDAINLNALVNGILFSNGANDSNGSPAADYDNEALTTFLQRGDAYARNAYEQTPEYQTAYNEWMLACEAAEVAGNPAPSKPSELYFDPTEYDEYCDEGIVKSEIKKSMQITVDQETTNAIQYDITYLCNWPATGSIDSTIRYQITAKTYSNVVENIYLFYAPSVFGRDIVDVISQPQDQKLNFYLAVQGDTVASSSPHIDIKIRETDSVSFFANYPNDDYPDKLSLLYGSIEKNDRINPNIVKAEPKDRIYEAEVKIYQYVDSTNISDKYKKELYSLSSATEN